MREGSNPTAADIRRWLVALGGMLRRALHEACILLALLGLPVGIVWTAFFLEIALTFWLQVALKAGYSLGAGFGIVLLWPWLWFGIGVILAGGVALQLLVRADVKANPELANPIPGTQVAPGPMALIMPMVQGMTILGFGFLDNGLRLRLALSLYLGYAAAALVLLVRRPGSLTTGDLLYLKWAWVPMVTLGVPLVIAGRAKGLL